MFLVPLLLLALCSPAEAQRSPNIPRIGYVSATGNANSPSSHIADFQRGLRDRGYIEGQNILVDYRYIDEQQDRVPGLIADLVRLKVDVLVIVSLSAIRAAKQATSAIPIVMVSAVDPVLTGLVDSLARPGRNVTGVTRLTRALSGKRLELLKEVLPGMSRAGVLWDAESQGAAVAFQEYKAVAPALKIQIQRLEIKAPTELEHAFQAAMEERVHAIIAIIGTLLILMQKGLRILR